MLKRHRRIQNEEYAKKQAFLFVVYILYVWWFSRIQEKPNDVQERFFRLKFWKFCKRVWLKWNEDKIGKDRPKLTIVK